MGLEEKITADIKSAMLAKDSGRLEALRAIKSAFSILKTSKEGFTEESGLKSIKSECKKRKEVAEVYIQQGRQDLADVELFQVKVMEEYLPKQMSEEEIRVALEKIISETGAKSPSEMGKVMGVANKTFAGAADNKVVSTIVKELLNKQITN